LRPGNSEERQPRAIEHQHVVAQPEDDWIPVEGHQTSEQRDGNISPVADSCWRDRADQHIAGDAAGIARRKGQSKHSEQIETFLDPG
jgi:hypothetical protein